MNANVKWTLNGREVEAKAGETIFEAAAREGMTIPTVCHRDGMRPAGTCRACVVDVGERTTGFAELAMALEPYTPERMDTAGNKAGITDGLFEIARAIRELAGAIKDARP
jgi:ferredoxin